MVVSFEIRERAHARKEYASGLMCMREAGQSLIRRRTVLCRRGLHDSGLLLVGSKERTHTTAFFFWLRTLASQLWKGSV